MKFRTKFSIFSFFILQFLTIEAETLPVISNYSSRDFPFISQIENLAQDHNGNLILGGKSGLFTFDGYSWRAMNASVHFPLTAISGSEDKIFAGSLGELGYFEYDIAGLPRFYSLKGDLPEETIEEEIIKVLPAGDDIYFQGRDKIFKFSQEDSDITVLYPPSPKEGKEEKYLNSFVINGEFYIQISNHSFYKLTEKGWTLYWPENLINETIIAIITSGGFKRSTSRIPEGTVVITERGVYVTDNGVPVKMNSGLDYLSSVLEISGVSEGPDNTIYIVSLNHGIINMDKDGNIKFLIDPDEIGGSRIIKDIFADSFGNIWILTPNNISIIHAGNKDFIIKGQSLDFTEDFQIENKDTDDKYSELIKTLDLPAQHYEIDNDGTIWGSLKSRGVIKISPAKGLEGVTSQKRYKNLTDSEDDSETNVLKIRNKLFFNQNGKYYSYNEEKDTFIFAEKITADLQPLGQIEKVVQLDKDRFVAITDEAIHIFEYDGNYNVICSISSELFPEFNKDESDKIRIKDNNLYLPLYDGVGIYNLDKKRKFPENGNLNFRFIGSYDKKGNLILLNPENKKASIKDHNITIALNVPNFERYPYKFRFLLKGGGVLTDTITSFPDFEFKSLPWGSYKLMTQVLGASGDILGEKNFNFTIARPWALRWWAWVCYIIIVAIMTLLLSRIWSSRHLKIKTKGFDEEKSKRDSMIKEQALIIASQAKKLREKQFTPRNKEISDLDLNADTRQMIIDDLRGTVALRRKMDKGVSQAERILKELSGSYEDRKMFLYLLERNFDIINEALYEKLQDKFPKLSSADMKFCALLRMDLNTKEISKFTNLSVRGVETARYRLRKKFGLTKESSLSEFLKGF